MKKLWAFAAMSGALAALGAAAVLRGLPDVSRLRDENPSATAFMGWRMAHAGAAADDARPYRVWVPLGAISPYLVHAVILSEDETFYRHHGFDLEQIQDAARLDWNKRRYVYGGSTITQQLARNLYLSPEKTMLRKAREAVIAWRLERALSKRRILELYLNVAEWGPGVFGAEAASQIYFGKHASELTAEEAVALAAALPSPNRMNPLHQTKRLARRRESLLERLRRAGFAPMPAPVAPFPAVAWERTAPLLR